MGYARGIGLSDLDAPFWGQLHVQRGMGHGLVVDEPLVLVARLVSVFVLGVAASGPARRARARVAVGDEEERAGACGRGERRGGRGGRGRGRERAHWRGVAGCLARRLTD